MTVFGPLLDRILAASICPEGLSELLTSDADMQPTQNLPPGRWTAVTLYIRLKTHDPYALQSLRPIQLPLITPASYVIVFPSDFLSPVHAH